MRTIYTNNQENIETPLPRVAVKVAGIMLLILVFCAIGNHFLP